MGKVRKMNKVKEIAATSENVKDCRTFVKSVFIFILACIFGGLNCYHEYSMFENDRHFSHLSTMEREMTFRTEMGLYYYYYKRLIEAPSFMDGLRSLVFNNITEFPKTINTLKRFNLYPEVFVGAAFRVFTHVCNYFQWETKECFVVNRGEGFSSVLSCEGIGDPAYFYIMSVFGLNAAVGALIFVCGIILSDSLFGGILTISSFFFNHGESTRVQWTPPLRESFGFPFWLAVLTSVTFSLKNRNDRGYMRILIALFSAAFLLTWQFAQFALLTQILSVYVVHLLDLSRATVIKTILQGQLIGLATAFILLFGNTLLINSFYSTALLVTYALVSYQEHCHFKFSIFRLVSHGCLLVFGSFLLKFLIGAITGMEDDVHIWNLLKSKMTSYRDFHTLLYTCAAEFDFLGRETLLHLTKTLLLPTALFVGLIVTIKSLKEVFYMKQSPENVEVIYSSLQLVAFMVMAFLFMRLKLFFTPQLCIFISLVASRQYWRETTKVEYIYGACAILLALMCVQGVKNISDQQHILGEYSNPELEELLLWVNGSTSEDAVFAGPMPTMANLILSTNRPIVNHPHYEDSDARARNLKVYSLYSRKSAHHVHGLLADMGVQFAILGKPWCYGESKPGCAMVELWDVQEPLLQNEPSLCHKLSASPAPFTKVFSNDHYIVLKI